MALYLLCAQFIALYSLCAHLLDCTYYAHKTKCIEIMINKVNTMTTIVNDCVVKNVSKFP